MGPVVLLIRDGWGVRADCEGNPLCTAKIPFTRKLLDQYPTAVLAASGEAVGLPKGYQGNSEVGHLTLGSGRQIYQSLARIQHSIEDRSFFSNPALMQAMKTMGCLHIMGLVQNEGVHAHNDHILALLEMAYKLGVHDVVVHAFTDGRDSPPKSAKQYLDEISRSLVKYGGRFGTIVGRYYAMDRDTRWERTQLAYDAIVKGKGRATKDVDTAILEAYDDGLTDEFITPRIVDGYEGLKEGDAVIFANYRYDRARQLAQAFCMEGFEGFALAHPIITFVAMTAYYPEISCPVAFQPQRIDHDLGSVLSAAGLKQLRISETEKYAHVTFFFNGLHEEPYPREDRVLIPSPKVATYDLQPEMEVHSITSQIVAALKHRTHDVIITNFVNGDMVGHTGKYDAVVKAVEAVDNCVQQVVEETLAQDGFVLITADHGNCEEMIGDVLTSHTTNPVHCIIVSKKQFILDRKEGDLSDIAPTILKILGLTQPAEMTGRPLLR